MGRHVRSWKNAKIFFFFFFLSNQILQSSKKWNPSWITSTFKYEGVFPSEHFLFFWKKKTPIFFCWPIFWANSQQPFHSNFSIFYCLHFLSFIHWCFDNVSIKCGFEDFSCIWWFFSIGVKRWKKLVLLTTQKWLTY